MTAIDIKSEPLTYRRDTRTSFFRDITLAARGDGQAAKRIAQHTAEMRVEVPKRDAEREARAHTAGVEYRVNPNRQDGQGGYFAVPLWLLDSFATAPRPMRVLSALMPNVPLPRGASEVKLPRLITGTDTGIANDGGAVTSRDIIDAAASQPVTAIAGISDVALQLLEQSPPGPHLDLAIFKDLTGSYDADLETLLINGSGVGNTFAGILNLTIGAAGVNAVTFTDANPTPAEMFVPIGQAFAQAGDARSAPPEVWLMRTARWGWLASVDSNMIVAEPRLLGRPIAMDDAIPANLAATGNQDAIITMRPSDSILFESEPRTEVFFEPLSGEMMARLRLHGNATALHRQPTGIATIRDTGMVVQSGY